MALTADGIYAPRDDDRTVTRLAPIPATLDHPTPQGHFGPYVPFADLPSRAPDQYRAGSRIDPMWSHLWDGPQTANWTSRADVARAIRGGHLRPRRKHVEMVTAIDPSTLWFGQGHRNRKRMLASALMWRTTTTDQMAALAQVPALCGLTGSELNGTITQMVGSDLLNVGTLSHTLYDVPPLLRPTVMPKWKSQSRQLSYADWLAITAGRRVVLGSQFARHNLLTTELSLRAAEFTNLFAVLGELCGRVEELVPVQSRQMADSVWIRPDGFKIAVEMTSFANADLEAKIEAWANTLAKDETRSIAVVFVAARRPATHRQIVPRLSKAIARSALANVERITARVAQRMFWVDWTDWFGEGGLVSTHFPTLPVYGLKKDVVDPEINDPWRILHIGDPSRTPWKPPSQEYAELTAQQMLGTQMLLGQPFWMRDPSTEAELRKRLEVWMIRKVGGLGQPILQGDGHPDDAKAIAAWRPEPLKFPVTRWPPIDS